MSQLKGIRSYFEIIPNAKRVKVAVEVISSELPLGDSLPAPSDNKIAAKVSSELELPLEAISSTSQSDLKEITEITTTEDFLKVDESWSNLLNREKEKAYFKKLMIFLKSEMKMHKIFPPPDHIFHALNLCPAHKVKVVVIGQDPYHGQGQAHGLAFSVQNGVQIPPSLRNIYKEANDDVGIPIPNHGCLEDWGKQGVLLLNTCLTVRSGIANSHQNQGWEMFTDSIVRELAQRNDRIIFLLWGNPAQTKCKSIDTSRHTIIKSSHPSPLGAAKTSTPFLGSRCFSRCNAALVEAGKDPIDWRIR